MDVSLPTEVFHKIFLQLSPRDLFNCMAVCKHWRDLINCRYVWEHFFKKLDIEELGSDEGSDDDNSALVPLCSQAKELKNFFLSPAYTWRSMNAKHEFLVLTFRQWHAVCCYPYLVIMYYSTSVLCVYQIVKDELVCIGTVSVNLPVNTVEQKAMLINSKYFVLGSLNITHVYKLGLETFSLYRVFAIKYDPKIYEAINDFDTFIKQNIESRHSVFERVLVDDMLWITDANGTKHIIDLSTGKKSMLSSSLLCTKVLPSSKYVLNHINVNVQITDVLGAPVSSFSVAHGDKSFSINSRIIVINFSRNILGTVLPVECREIVTGKLIRRIGINERTRLALHSQKDILFLLDTTAGSYRVSSICIETGDCLWRYEGAPVPRLFWGSFLMTISNRYLLVYPSPISDDMYALFSLKGKLLVVGAPFPSGVLIHISETFLVAKEEGRLHLVSFL